MVAAEPTNQPQNILEDAASVGRILYDTTGQLLSPRGQREWVSGWTDLAKKYSFPLGKFRGIDHSILLPLKKSGLTPTSPIKTKEERRKLKWKRRLEIYQRRRFRGFTAAELHDMGALAALDTAERVCDLRNPIHPIFRKSQWFTEETMPKHRGAVPILGAEEGFWLAENPFVWDILEPILRLATLMLTNQCRYSWLDALFNGQFETAHNDSVGKVITHFYERPHIERIRRPTNELLQDQIMRMCNNVWFALHSGYEELSSGLSVKPTNTYGITRNHGPYERVEISIAIEMLQPLLRKDLTDAEKLGLRLRAATTFLHELAHAAWRSIVLANEQEASVFEPYFANEPLSELGYSFMDKIWGGQPESIIRPLFNKGGPGLPNGGFYKTNWFTIVNASYRTSFGAPVLNPKPPEGQEDPFRNIEYWPVPTSWYCDVFRENFWECDVRRKGPAAAAMTQAEFGVRVIQAPIPKVGGYYETLEYFLVDELLPEREKLERQLEQRRSMRARQIEDATVRRRRNGDEHDSDSDLVEYDAAEISSMKPPEVTYHCPRWDEITSYLFNNRGPLELALDTMGTIPVPSFYRYIRDRGGISLTPLEFRNFLGVASAKGELFRWKPYPGPGLIRRIPTGWPPTPDPPHTTPLPANKPDMGNLEALDDLMSDDAVQKSLYNYRGQAMDMDMDNFQRWLYWRWGDTELLGLGREGFRDVIVGSLEGDGGYFTVGPEGIIRFLPWSPGDGDGSESSTSSGDDAKVEFDDEYWECE